MNWIGEEFGKFKSWVQGIFSAHNARLEALEAKVKELEGRLQVPEETPAAGG